MIKRFIRRVLGLRTDAPQRVPREQHSLRRTAISLSLIHISEPTRH